MNLYWSKKKSSSNSSIVNVKQSTGSDDSCLNGSLCLWESCDDYFIVFTVEIQHKFLSLKFAGECEFNHKIYQWLNKSQYQKLNHIKELRQPFIGDIG